MRVHTFHLIAAGMVLVLLGGMVSMRRAPGDADLPTGPRRDVWRQVDRHFREGRPKSAAAALEGLAEQAIADEAWAEVARAIASQVLAETGDRPQDDPERLLRLDAALATAPPQTQPVLEAVAANWTWQFFVANRWRFMQRTTGAAGSADLASIGEWDLRQIVAEIERRFSNALQHTDRLRAEATSDWLAIVSPGAMRVVPAKNDEGPSEAEIASSLAARPSLWDVLITNALEFYASGERGLINPEDVFEPQVDGPLLGPREAFLEWKPAEETSDVASPILKAITLYQEKLQKHRDDADRTALLTADFERIEWAAGVGVGEGARERIRAAWEAFVAAAGDHEIAARARHRLAEWLLEEEDPAAAHAIASHAVAAHPESVGAALCRNLITTIETPTLAFATERTWAEPWPVIRTDYTNLTRMHLRIVKADWKQRLEAGRPEWQWLDEDDRSRILAEKPERRFAVDLPATPDYKATHQSVPVPEDLAPGCYWVLASATDTFLPEDNVLTGCFVWVSRLEIVADTPQPVVQALEDRGKADDPGVGVLSGHVVDIQSGEPIVGAVVKGYAQVRDRQQQAFREFVSTSTDAEGRYEIALDREAVSRDAVVLSATATLDGVTHVIGTDRTGVRSYRRPVRARQVVLVTDRGIHRPGQVVFYKGIAAEVGTSAAHARAVAGETVTVTFRDANGRELGTREHRTSAMGSFHGTFSIPAGALPGQWSITSQGDGMGGGVGVRVEEYKRPKFEVTLAAPTDEVRLTADVAIRGEAMTYTGLPVANASVAWEVEREVRFAPWCRWFFPWLPFDQGAARIAHGEATSDADGSFELRFPAKPDLSVPRDALPVFRYRVTARVTDASGETRVDERSVQAGYAPIEAMLRVEPYQAAEGGKADVAVTVETTSLDGDPRSARGELRVTRLVQPDRVAREDWESNGIYPRRSGRRPLGRGMGGGMFAVPADAKDLGVPVNPAEPETWADGETVFSSDEATDGMTGKVVAAVPLEPGIYRATFEVPGEGDVPTVKATELIEVLDPQAQQYPIRRAFAVAAPRWSVEPGETFEAVLGTGYDAGRVRIEVFQNGQLLSRQWSEPGRTQWRVQVPVEEQHRGGFSLRLWMMRDGRLSSETRTIDVPWNDKKLAVSWERFTRRLEPGVQEVWRAKVATTPETLRPDAMPAVVEMLAILYDQSLDALAPHAWPSTGLASLFRREASPPPPNATNAWMMFHQFGGGFARTYESVEIRLPTLLGDFGSSGGGPMLANRRGFGGMGGFGGGAMFGREADFAAAPMAMADAAEGESWFRQQAQASAMLMEKSDGAEAPPSSSGGSPAAPPPPRRNLAETAFFLPTLVSDAAGIVTIEFTPPDTLTTWQFKGLAHDAALRSGAIEDTAVAVKDLMVEPVMPRFLREGDRVRIPVKLSNRSTGRLSGTVRFALSDARTGEDRSSLVSDGLERSFDLAAGESQPVFFSVAVANGTQALTYLATGTAGRAADGEEGMLPVLSRRVLVSQTAPITLRGDVAETVTLEKLAQGADEIESQSLVVQVASNPAWYAVLAMPSLMEEEDEGIDALFRRLSTNSLARHLVARDQRIARVFEQWRGTDALESPLEKNSELVKTLLAETPWVRDAVDEKEARHRIGLLFDATRAENEVAAALQRLAALHNNDGGWPWFPGGTSSDVVTLSIVSGFGRLRTQGVAIDQSEALRAIPWVDGRLIEEANRGRRLAEKVGNEEVVLTPTGVFALYARSFFLEDQPPADEVREAIRFCLAVGRTSWMKLGSRRTQAQLAIALHRARDRQVAMSILESLRERAVGAPGTPEANLEGVAWQGMWWRDPHPAWWSWQGASIETQAQLIEAFDEVAGDAESVEAMKGWLLTQKRTSRWAGSPATANAIAAILGRGDDLLGQPADVQVTIGGTAVEPDAVEAGTGFFETRLVRGEITPEDGTIRFTRTSGKAGAGFAWGGVHWQYLDDLDRVEAAGLEQLAIRKELFAKRITKAGPTLEPVGEETPLRVGDELVVRLVVTSDRDYEYLELFDHRPSLTEPVDVLSGWRWGDGVGWYLSVRDTSTQFFFERMPRGTHVLEYSLRVAHAGTASTGFASIRSRYAPEFAARSASLPIFVMPADHQP
jgi:hypothetical protein